jgi:hypothetical protein
MWRPHASPLRVVNAFDPEDGLLWDALSARLVRQIGPCWEGSRAARDQVALQAAGHANLASLDRARLAAGTRYVLAADLNNCGRSVSLDKLLQELSAAGAGAAELDLLTHFLGQCGRAGTQGFPSFRCAVTVRNQRLLDFYLATIDRALVDGGFDFWRYLDDMRVYCRDREEAVRALGCLCAALEQRGVYLNWAKTGIYPARQVGAWYEKPARGETVPVSLAPALVVAQCLEVLRLEPWHTQRALGQLRKVCPPAADREALFADLHAGALPYPVQAGLVIRTAYEAGWGSEALRRFCLQLVFDVAQTQWARSLALAYLGRYGTPAEWEQLPARFAQAASDLERADLVAALAPYAPQACDVFYATIRPPSFLERQALRWARTGAARAGSPVAG